MAVNAKVCYALVNIFRFWPKKLHFRFRLFQQRLKNGGFFGIIF